MKELFDAVLAHYNTASIPLQLYNTQADDKAEFPYAVVQVVVGGTADVASNKHFTEDWLIQFNLFDDAPDMAALLEAYALLIAAFDFGSLTIAGHTFLSCTRPPGSTRQTKVDGVWQINVESLVKARKL